MLHTLNDDCLRLILKKLDNKEKIILAKTCQYLHDIINDHFRMSFPIFLDEHLWNHLLQNESKPKEFLNFISKNVQKMELNTMNRKQLMIARNCKFSRLKSLKIESIKKIEGNKMKNAFIEILKGVTETLEEFSFIKSDLRKLYILSTCELTNVKYLTISDSDDGIDRYSCMQKIGKIFPNISKMTLINPQTRYLFQDLKNLVELEVVFKFDINLDPLFHVSNIKKLIILVLDASCHQKCYSRDLINSFQKLEFLQADIHVLFDIPKYFNVMSKIRKLVFTYEKLIPCHYIHTLTWYEIYRSFQNRIEYLAIDSLLLSTCKDIDEFFSICLPKLRHLVIFDKHCFEKLLLEKSIPPIKMHGWRKSINVLTNVLKKLQYCVHLENFDVSGNIFDLEFLKSAIFYIRLRNQKHYKPFLFRCFHTKIEAEDLKELVLPPGIQVLLRNYIFDIPKIVAFEMEVTPISNE